MSQGEQPNPAPTLAGQAMHASRADYYRTEQTRWGTEVGALVRWAIGALLVMQNGGIAIIASRPEQSFAAAVACTFLLFGSALVFVGSYFTVKSYEAMHTLNMWFATDALVNVAVGRSVSTEDEIEQLAVRIETSDRLLKLSLGWSVALTVVGGLAVIWLS